MKKPKIEEWESVNGYDGLYEVSTHGRVRSFKNSAGNRVSKPKIISSIRRPNGYHQICLSKNGNTKYILLHRMVAYYFLENPENKKEVNHIDGDKSNNSVWNLEWATSSENQKHAHRIGLCSQKGIKNANSKLTEDQVLEIRNSYRIGCFSQREIAKAYRVDQMTICRIVRRDTWRHI